MTSKIKKILASLLALAALALGGAAIASATNGNSGEDQGAQEKAAANENESLPEGADDNKGEDGQEVADPGEAVSASAAAKAEAAAVARTGGTVRQVTAETNDAPEQGDEQGDEQDNGEQASPAGTAYQVDLTKGSSELTVSLDKQFNVLKVQTERAD